MPTKGNQVKKTAAAHVVVGVTGSIAAYKAAELVRLLVKSGREVSVIMTKAATRFVGALTFRSLSRNPVVTDMFDDPEEWVPGHVAVAERADILVIAPCSANLLAKLAHGIADDMLSCTALATRAPVVVAPAMNENMWDHPATRANVETLRARGVRIVDVGEGELACGREGRGRMADPEAIMRVLDGMLNEKRRA